MKNQITTEQMIKEIMWENHQIEEGVAKYNSIMDKKTLDQRTGGQKLMQKAITGTIEGVSVAFADVESILLTGNGTGAPQNWIYMLGLITPEQAAVITINKLLEYCQSPKHSDKGYTGLCRGLADALRTQSKFEAWKIASKADTEGQLDTKGNQLKMSPAQMLIKKSKGQVNRQKLQRWEKKFDNYINVEWSESDKMNIGMKLINIACVANPDLFDFQQKMEKNKTLRTLELTESAWAIYEQSEDFAEVQRPFLLPTLVAPVDYSYVDGKVKGGYHHIDTPFFSRGLHAHTAGDDTAASQSFLDSINTVQRTAWKINPYILMVVDMVFGTGSDMGGITQACSKTMPEYMDAETFAALSKLDKDAFQSELRTVQEQIASERGRHSAFTRKLSIAHKMAPHAEFYFPHFADFRGRLYPLPQELTPQGDQIAKALLMFANGEKLGPTGLKWLMIHAANTFGMDKETLANREKWAIDNLKMMAEVSSNPLTNKGWTKADEPFTFLAAAKEITTAMELEDPREFVSHIASAQDGTVNGMQILSLLGRDQVGATATNCTASPVRQDLYSEVAITVITMLKANSADCAISAEWYDLLKDNAGKARKVVKRAIMTTPYGVTAKGIATQLVNDKHCNGFKSGTREEAAFTMTETILAAMTSVNGKAVEIMSYFQEVAGILAENGENLTWYTPNGLKVTQSYQRTTEKRVLTVFGDVRLEVEDKDLGLIAQRSINGSSPNIIHSFDAAMLQMTVTKLEEQGFTDFAMIHDSYGMHSGNVEALHVALREVALEIFGGDVLSDLHTYLQSTTELVLPTPPALGSYDVNEITQAVYFFS